MQAALYQNHPYRIPIIGWMHEIKKLSREDALGFYKRFYAPNNAIVVVAGDITADEVKTMAEAAYGSLKPNPDQDAHASGGAAASGRPARRGQGPARGQRLGAALLPRTQLPHGAARRGGSLAHPDEDRRPGHHQPPLSKAGRGRERLQRAAAGTLV